MTTTETVYALPPEQYLLPCLPPAGAYDAATVAEVTEELPVVLTEVIRKCNEDKRKLREWRERYDSR